METLLISSDSKKDLKLIKELAQKIGARTKTVSLENLEDITFGKMMEEAKTGKQIDKSLIMKSLL